MTKPTQSPAERKAEQEQRRAARKSAPDKLRAAGISFTEHNKGAHLIIDAGGRIDFWPGTGRWIVFGSKKKQEGIDNLIVFCKSGRESKPPSRFGPMVRVEYQCNGCEYHGIKGLPGGVKGHTCRHPMVIHEHGCEQSFGGGRKDLTIYDIAHTPKYLCPYVNEDE